MSAEAAEALFDLERSADPARRAIARRVHALRELLLRDALHGEVVRKGRIPGAFRSRYGATNLYVEDLPSFWRLLYTVAAYRGRRFVLVLAIVDHRTYSGWFRRGHR